MRMVKKVVVVKKIQTLRYLQTHVRICDERRIPARGEKGKKKGRRRDETAAACKRVDVDRLQGISE